MSNPLNLHTATFTRVNVHGVEEQQTITVRHLLADYGNFSSSVALEGRTAISVAAPDAPPIEHRLEIPLDLTDPIVQQAVAIISGLIWQKALTTPCIVDYEVTDGKWTPVKKSLSELGAVIEDVDLDALMHSLATSDK